MYDAGTSFRNLSASFFELVNEALGKVQLNMRVNEDGVRVPPFGGRICPGYLHAERPVFRISTVKLNTFHLKLNIWITGIESRQLLDGSFQVEYQSPLFPPRYTTTQKGHGRIETRSVQVFSVLQGYSTFPYLEQVLRIERVRTIIKTRKTEREIVFGVTSLPPEQAGPKELSELVRGHWCIENRLHYVRGFTFDEDRSQVRTGLVPG